MKASDALPALVQTLKSSDEEVRKAAVESVLAIDPQNVSAKVLQAVLGLNDQIDYMRKAHADHLAELGAAAESALPALTNLLTDTNLGVRISVTNAIIRIAGKKQ